VSDFVEECRREWRRLQVPEPAANEMAADLAADLREAEAEGASAEEVLGNAAFDPRSFAASWAIERGLVQPARRSRLARRSLLITIGVAALLIVGAALAALAVFSTARNVASPQQVTAQRVTVEAPTTTVAMVVVPNAIGLHEEQAIAQLQRVGLSVRIVYRKTRGGAKNIVSSETPPPGTTVAHGATLTLVVTR
jgi:hypothetical protein